jgi:drug/metabolite transporter (DMT)-like permease
LPGEVEALIAAFIWGFTGVILAGLTRRLGAISINAFRTACGSILLLVVAVAVAGSELHAMSARTALSMAGSGILAFGVGDTFYILALRRLGATIAVPIGESAYPLFTFFLAWVWLDETFSRGLLIGTALVLAGIVFLTSREAPVAGEAGGSIAVDVRSISQRRGSWLVGLPVVLAASVFWAISTVWLRAGSGNLGPEGAAAMRVLPVSIVLLIAVQASPGGMQIRRYSLLDMTGAAAVDVFGLAIASLVYVSAIQEIGASKTSILTATVPLFTLPLAVIFLKERVTPRVVAGTIVCTLGIWFII